MSRRTEVLLKRERMDVTLPILIDYYVTSKQVKGCSHQTLVNLRSSLNKFI